MRHIRPLDAARLGEGEAGPWLIALEEDLGCAVRVRRGGSAVPAAPDIIADRERFLLLLGGEVQLAGKGEAAAVAGELVFIPAGADARIEAAPDALWVEIEAPLPDGDRLATADARIFPIDQGRFEGTGFAYQSLVDKSRGASTMRMNVLQVQPGAGSPDYHIHAFAQIYVIQDGVMTVDVGTARLVAPAGSLVVLPAGVVHRNFNASDAIERHVSLLVPEPKDGEIFDFAVTIHDREAALLSAVPDPI